MSVFGADEQSLVTVDLERWTRLVRLVLDDARIPGVAEVSLLFVDEQSIADLNERFLGATGPTDVLAFPIDDDLPVSGRQPDQGGRGPGAPAEPREPPTLIGDVVVCPAVAIRQAVEHGWSTDEELALLVVHGVLHLLNYDHADEDQRDVMQGKERELLARFRALEGEQPESGT